MATGEIPFGISKSLADDYLSIDGLPLASSPLHTPGEGLIAELENRDPRMLQTIATPADGEFTYFLEGKRVAIANLFNSLNEITVNNEKIDLTKSENSKYKWADKGASSTGYPVVKFYNPDEDQSAHHQGSIDAPIFRFAEILLIYAEACAELGDEDMQAVLDVTVNKLRERVGFDVPLTTAPTPDPRLQEMYPNIAGGNADLIREIRRERRVETFGEGLRFYDILRWKIGHVLNKKRAGFVPDPSLYSPEEIEKLESGLGILPNGSFDVYGQRVTAAPDFTEKNYLLSLPINEMALNPNLRPNNPGWD
ncbi:MULTISPECIES: RagB/SusD family nutrient uptake outer membrane protein [unclassified Carboxylicivirga]|uniref:RagB/SusD family nutrient uptake outer membrane protein n=1 Tax=Carboxylicivirga TaxID=1628153 RepID=UPI003D3526C0